jgi:hypothetical protein
MSCPLSIWSAFIDGLFTNRDRESVALLMTRLPLMIWLPMMVRPSLPSVTDTLMASVQERRVPLDHVHLSADGTPLADLPLQNDEGVVLHP